MNESRIKVRVEAPEGTAEPFTVTVTDEQKRFCESKAVYANEKVEFSVPEGRYMLRVRGGPFVSPRGQCKWVRVCRCRDYCYSAIFRENLLHKTEMTVRFFLRDANYPNLILLNGGITYMAAEERTITFTNGESGPVTLPAGTYTFVSSTIRGYEGNGVTATDFTITQDGQQVVIEITADGVLTVNVVDDAGAPVTDGSLVLADSTGATEYGDPVPISGSGTATFNNVPYDADDPVDVWIKQLATDDTHIAMTGTQAEELEERTTEATILNQRKTMTVTIKTVDANYEGLVPLNGSLVFQG